MDRKTKAILITLEEMRKFPWEPGIRVGGMDVHLLVHALYGLTKSLGLGTVFLKRERKEKMLSRLEATRREIEFREDIDRFLALVEEGNGKLGEVIDGIMLSLGYHRHNRDTWQLNCQSTIFQKLRDTVNNTKNTKSDTPTLPIPPDQEAEVRKLFARARKGDDDALKQVQEMIRDRKWADFLEYLEKSHSRAHRRYLQSLRELAQVRRLQAGFLKRALRHPGRAEVHTLINPPGNEMPTKGDG